MLLCDNIKASYERYMDPVALGFPASFVGSDTHLAQLVVLQTAADLLDGAVRYVLAPEVIEAACHVVMSKPTTIRDAMRLVRVPRSRMWVEWHDDARQTLRTNLGITAVNGKPPPARFGFLLEADETGRKGTCRFAWAHRPDPEEPFAEFANICSVGAVFDFDAIGNRIGVRPDIDHEHSGLVKRWKAKPDQIEALIELNMAADDRATPEGEHYIHSVAHDLGEHTALKMLALAREDVEGEFMQVMSVLIMLSARNGVMRVPGPDLSRLNKARAKKKKTPLLEHQVVTMRLNKGDQKASGGRGAGGLSPERRGHMVEGHFVVRGKPREVIYWRREHYRSGTLPAAKTKTVHVRM